MAWLFRECPRGRAPDTVPTMVQPRPIPGPPSEPIWDITFTRLTQAVRPGLEACALDLVRRFQAIGIRSDTQVRPTPRGLSTFLALLGQRGLIGIVDITVVDGMAVDQGRCAWLDMRLLDACGDVVAEGLASGVQGRTSLETSVAQALMSAGLERAATAVYVASLAHFDLLRPVIGQA